jgi:hypothetical protein
VLLIKIAATKKSKNYAKIGKSVAKKQEEKK